MDMREKMLLQIGKPLKSYENRMWVFGSPCPDPTCRPVICIFHDESTFYANADQTFHWSRQILKQKSLGQAIMVSDFVEEVGGLLEFEGEKACLLLEHQSEGYFNNDMLIAQVSIGPWLIYNVKCDSLSGAL